jgi:co-chaperonin GroES (HSP10)
MRNFIIAGILFILASCGQNAEQQGPADQIKFVNYVKFIRDAVNSSDEANRSVQLNNGVLLTKAYVKDSLSLKFDSWHTTLVEINEKPTSTEVNFSIPLDSSNKSAQKAIILSALLYKNKKELTDKLKVGDNVIISGNFIEKEGFIDIDSYSNYKFSKNVFDNPEFKIELVSIE